MKGRTPTADEARYMTALKTRIGCWCCTHMDPPIENREEDVLPHHTVGKTTEYAHYMTIPLCSGHHDRGYATGFHQAPYEWEAKWGKQEKIVAEIHKRMDWDFPLAAIEYFESVLGVYFDRENYHSSRAAVPAANMECSVGDESVATAEGAEKNTRYDVHVHSVRKRLADIDGISAKAAIDGIVHAGILEDDSAKQIRTISYSQEKGEPEKTTLTLTEVEPL